MHNFDPAILILVTYPGIHSHVYNDIFFKERIMDIYLYLLIYAQRNSRRYIRTKQWLCVRGRKVEMRPMVDRDGWEIFHYNPIF